MRLETLIAAIATVLAAGCAPGGETGSAPSVTISAIEGSGSSVVTTSDPSGFPPGFACPGDEEPGRFFGGDMALVRGYPVRILVSAADSGGIRYVSAHLQNATVSDVQPPDTARRTQDSRGRTFLILERSLPADDPGTPQVISFEVTPAGAPSGILGAGQFQIAGFARDYSGNSAETTFPAVGTLASFCD